MAVAAPTEYGGYEYKFMNPVPDRCVCNICHFPSRDAYMTGQCCQGLTICKSCLDQWQTTAGNAARCPVCRNEEGEFHPNYPIVREIKGLHIYCTNKEKGCEWQGELNDINNHLGNSDGCPFEEANCSNECGKMIQRRYLTSHVETECPRRKVNCQYCHDEVEHQFIEGQHKEECPKLPLPCPNNCEVGSVLREDMEAHRKECPLEIIQCEYYSVGCKRVKLARKDQGNHDDEKMKEHLMMIKHRLSKLDDIEHELTDTVTKAQLAAALRQIADLTAVLMNAQLGSNTAVSHANIRSIQLDSIAAIFKCGSQVCPTTIKLTEYNINKRDGVQWNTDPFYTHNEGYKMCLRVHAAGKGKGKDTHLSVYLYLMKGPHDDELTWPLRGRFVIKLLNQISDNEHHSDTVTYDDNTSDSCAGRVIEGHKSKTSWGKPKYISNKDLNKVTPTRQYLKDDCLFFQVMKL